jgi:hypothetical protein
MGAVRHSVQNWSVMERSSALLNHRVDLSILDRYGLEERFGGLSDARITNEPSLKA